MLYLAIDQHTKQITVCVRNEERDTVLRRQVSTSPEKIESFFQQLTEMDNQFMAILEVCGFNDWLIECLQSLSCREIVLIHPEKPSKRKTDRRDAHKLADLCCGSIASGWLRFKPFMVYGVSTWCPKRNAETVSSPHYGRLWDNAVREP